MSCSLTRRSVGVPRRAPPLPAKPHITQRPIPFPAKRKRETAAYAQRHYGTSTFAHNAALVQAAIALRDEGGA